jgi:signal peptidase
MKKIIKIGSHLINVILVVVVLVMAFFVVSSKASGGEPQAFGYQLKSVLSGSMEPIFQTGSIIAVKPLNDEAKADLKKGDIITFKDSQEQLITHRITKVISEDSSLTFETKGDNNQTKDLEPVLSQNVVAQYSNFTIPYIGYLLNYASTKEGTALLLIVPGILLILYAAFTIFQAIREIDSKPKTKDPSSKTA